MKTLDKSSIITAIFKRKGGESEFTERNRPNRFNNHKPDNQTT